MRKKSMFVAGMSLLLAATLSVGMSSCSNDEPSPVIVENPLDKENYYIAGVVTSEGKALEGVAISTDGAKATSAADGSFQLAVAKKGGYAVTFAKEGFVTVSGKAEIASDAKRNSSVLLDREMVAANASVTVKADEEAVIVEAKEEVASLVIPAGSLKEETAISITEYLEGETGSDRMSLSSVSCTPDGIKFEKPIEFSVKNLMSNEIRFANVKHYVEKEGQWVELSEAAFDASKNAYVMELDGFSNHSARPQSEKAKGGKSSEDFGEVVVDNLGKMEAVDKEVSVTQKSGWVVDGDLSAAIRTQFDGISDSDVSALSDMLNRSLAQSKGSQPGVKESKFSLGNAKVSGDTKMTVKMRGVRSEESVTFYLEFKGKQQAFTVNVLVYDGVDTSIEYEYGEHRTDHSGSAIG